MKKIIIIFFLLLVLSMSLIGCAKNDPEVVSINNQIEELNNIQDNRESILEIMNIREEIELLSSKQKKWVETKQLNNISNKVSNELKDSMKWSQYLSKETDFVLINSLVDLSEMEHIMQYPYLGFLSSQLPFERDNEEYVNKFIKSISLPFVEVLDYLECAKMIRDIYSIPISPVRMSSLRFSENGDIKSVLVEFMNGWVIISYTKDGVAKTYVSLVNVGSEIEKSLYGY